MTLASLSPTLADREPVVSLRGVGKTFSNGTVALENLDLDVFPGEFLSLLGPSGCGKSTALRLMAGLGRPSRGRVSIASHDPGERRGNIGFVFQEPTLMPWATVADNVWLPLRLKGVSRAKADATIRDSLALVGLAAACYFAEEAHIFSTSVRENLRVARGDVTDEEIGEALRTVGLDGWLARLPEGLDTTLSGGAEAVSGGERRRLLLARALLHRAPVVLLDEPTEHLSADDADHLLRRLLGAEDDLFGPDRIVVVVTHQLPAEIGHAKVVEPAGAAAR